MMHGGRSRPERCACTPGRPGPAAADRCLRSVRTEHRLYGRGAGPAEIAAARLRPTAAGPAAMVPDLHDPGPRPRPPRTDGRSHGTTARRAACSPTHTCNVCRRFCGVPRPAHAGTPEHVRQAPLPPQHAILSPAARRCCKSDLQVVVLCHTPVHGDLHPAGSAVTIIQGAMEVPWMSKTSGPDRPRKCSGIKLT